MKRKILLFILMFVLGGVLIACKPNESIGEIEIKEVDVIVKWTEIEFIFNIEGEDENYEVVEGSLNTTLSTDGKAIVSRQPSLNIDDNYRVLFSALKIDTEYELVITGTVNLKKVELYKKTFKTLLDGGDVDNPLIINTVEDWANISNVYAYYKLGADLDFNGEAIPTPFSVTGLRGGFDGNNFSIKNFKPVYLNFNGIFGNMNSGTAVVQNLVIEDVVYNNYENIENKKVTSLYSGLLTREIATGVTVKNITFRNIDATLFTETYGIRYFGLVAEGNRGTIENITFSDVNFTVHYNNLNEIRVGTAVGKNYASGKISKVNYENGDFTVLAKEHSSNPERVNDSFIGTIVGEGSGKLSEVISNADVKVLDREADLDQRVVVLEGDNIQIKADSLGEDFVKGSPLFVQGDEPFTVKVTPGSNETVSKVLVDGVDRTADLIENTLTIPASLKTAVIQVSYKNNNTDGKFNITGSNFEIVTQEGEETPDQFDFGTVVTVKGLKRFGNLTAIKVNGVSHPITDETITFTVEKNSRIDVLYSSTKTVYIGGIAGGAKEINNAVFTGSITQQNKVPFRYHEVYQISSITGALYLKANNILVEEVTISLNNEDLPRRTLNVGQIAAATRLGVTISDVSVVNSTISINGLLFDDGNEVVTERPENLITSEYLLEILNK